jgi:hypothetical protein
MTYYEGLMGTLRTDSKSGVRILLLCKLELYSCPNKYTTQCLESRTDHYVCKSRVSTLLSIVQKSVHVKEAYGFSLSSGSS